jgi:hypothetical protein
MEEFIETRDLERITEIHTELAEKHGFELQPIRFRYCMEYQLRSREHVRMGDFQFPPDIRVHHRGADDDTPEYVVTLDTYFDEVCWGSEETRRGEVCTSLEDLHRHTGSLLELKRRLGAYNSFQGGDGGGLFLFFYVPGADEKDITELDRFLGTVSSYLAELKESVPGIEGNERDHFVKDK